MNPLRNAVFLLSFVTLCACGGSGGSSSAPADNPPAASGSGSVPEAPPEELAGSPVVMAMGVITGFGSIFVNGIEFETSSASFLIDDEPGREDALAIGQVVMVTGSIAADGRSGIATEVRFEHQVEGPVTAVDVALGVLEVAGQPVLTDAATRLDDSLGGLGPDTFSVGQWLEVSGHVDSAGAVLATLIESGNPAGDVEVHGLVSALDNVAMRFQLSGLVIDFSAAQLDDFPFGQINVADPVEVHGTNFAADGTLQATRVEYEGGTTGTAEEAEIEGLITVFNSATEFSVAGWPVTTDGATLFENGSVDDLRAGLKVEAEGSMGATGLLHARKISFRPDLQARIEGAVDSIDAAARTLTVLGIVVQSDALTQISDDSDAEVARFTLEQINIGDYVEVRGSESGADPVVVMAAAIERQRPDEDLRVRGRVSGIETTGFVVLGLGIQTGPGTRFANGNEQALSAEAFFAALTEGTQVQVKGAVLSGGVLSAEEVQFEN